jgi:NADH-quinone oxidoreductase subunit C
MEETLREFAEYIASKRGEAVIESRIAFGELTLTVVATEIVELTRFLRDDPRLAFVSFIDICGVDYPSREKRFDVVYHLLSPRQNVRIRLKVATDEATPVPSLTACLPRRRLVRARGLRLSTASASAAIRTSAASSRTTASTAIRCARTSR